VLLNNFVLNGQISAFDSLLHIVCREAEHRRGKVLHAVIEMVETASVQLARRGRIAGRGLNRSEAQLMTEGNKPPKGAVVKSHGTERLGTAKPS
jgi:hypothetical protein